MGDRSGLAIQQASRCHNVHWSDLTVFVTHTRYSYLYLSYRLDIRICVCDNRPVVASMNNYNMKMEISLMLI